jgi:hypothetical protein
LRLLKRLRPYTEITEPAAAPAGSGVYQLLQEVAEHRVAADEFDARVLQLRDRLGEVERTISNADEASDFLMIAAAMAEREVIGRVLRDVEDQTRQAHGLAAEAEQRCAGAWDAARRTISRLQRGIAEEPRNHRDQPWEDDPGWASLQELLGASAGKQAA